VRNINDGVSAAQIADGALSQVSDLYSRNAELAAQAANGTVSDQQRATLDQEYQENLKEIDRISQTTQFNGQPLLSGGGSISLQVGSDSSSNSQISLQLQSVATSPSSISSQANAQSALDSSKQSIEGIAAQRGQIGAAVNRLDSARSNNLSKIEGEQAAASQIRDVDYAAEAANKVANDIRAGAGVAILAQANLSKKQVLNLLS
jgi:flagellin